MYFTTEKVLHVRPSRTKRPLSTKETPKVTKVIEFYRRKKK